MTGVAFVCLRRMLECLLFALQFALLFTFQTGLDQLSQQRNLRHRILADVTLTMICVNALTWLAVSYDFVNTLRYVKFLWGWGRRGKAYWNTYQVWLGSYSGQNVYRSPHCSTGRGRLSRSFLGLGCCIMSGGCIIWFMKLLQRPWGRGDVPPTAPGVGTNLGPSRGLGDPPGRWWCDWCWGAVVVVTSDPPVLFSRPNGNLFGESERFVTLLVTPATTCCNEFRKLIVKLFFSAMSSSRPGTDTCLPCTRFSQQRSAVLHVFFQQLSLFSIQ